jgi:cellobiose-specific phosphotransferase system component IIC
LPGRAPHSISAAARPHRNDIPEPQPGAYAGGTSLLTGFAYIIITHTLWFFGLHGTNILDGVIRSLFLSGSETNIALAQAGLSPLKFSPRNFSTCSFTPAAAGLPWAC